MDVEIVFHMNGGLGDTSYFNNSSIQKSVAEMMKGIILEAMEETYTTLRPKSIGIADLGCSSGSNSLVYIKRLIRVVETASHRIQQAAPEIRVCLNDLPTNDFNTIFQALPELYELEKGMRNNVVVAAYPGNFYGRVFPENSLHFVYSFRSLHWLSKIPRGIYDEQGRSLNKTSIYITESSPRQVWEAYAEQFQEDFAVFLEARSAEVVCGGRMVLEITGRNHPYMLGRDNTFLWEILYQSLHTLVCQGKIEEEKLESYEVHYYEPSKEEIKEAVTKEGSFKLERLEMLVKEVDLTNSGVAIAKTVRAVQESMLSHHFGEAILDDLFDQYVRLLETKRDEQNISVTDIALVLTKLG